MAKLLKDIIQDKIESSIFDPDKIIADFKAQTGHELNYDGDRGFKYEGSLVLRGTKITELPDNLTVHGSLNLKGTKITKLPDNLTVGMSLYLTGTQITELPDNLTVRWSLYLTGTPITSLPDNLTVGDSLYLNGTKITELPDNLNVGWCVYLNGTKIKKSSLNSTVKSKIFKDFWKMPKWLNRLRSHFKKKRSLYLVGTKIKSLPDNLNTI